MDYVLPFLRVLACRDVFGTFGVMLSPSKYDTISPFGRPFIKNNMKNPPQPPFDKLRISFTRVGHKEAYF